MKKNRFTLFILFLLLNSTSSSTMNLIPAFNKKFFITTSTFILLNIIGRYLFWNTKEQKLLENEIKNSREELDKIHGFERYIWYSIQNIGDLYIQKSSSPSKLTKALKKLAFREEINERLLKERKLKNIKEEPQCDKKDLELLIKLLKKPIKITIENTKVKKFHTREKKLNHLKNKINLNGIFWKSGSILCPLIYYNKGLSYTGLSAALLLGSYLIIDNNKDYKNILKNEQLVFSSLNNYENFLKKNEKNFTIDFSLISYDDFKKYQIPKSKDDPIEDYILLQKKYVEKLKEKVNALRENEKKDEDLYKNILTAKNQLLETQKNSWCGSGLAFIARTANRGAYNRFL